MTTTEQTNKDVEMSDTAADDERNLKTFDFETLLMPSSTVMRRDMAQWTKLCLIRLYPITLDDIAQLKSYMSDCTYCTMKFGRDAATADPLKGMLMLHFLHPEDAIAAQTKLRTVVSENVQVNMMNEDAKNFFNPDNTFSSPHINFKIQDNDAVVYVGNLPPNATEAALSEIFTEPKVRMAYNADAAPLGYAYMFYDSSEMAAEAAQNHAMCTTLGGHLLAIKLMSKISCELTDAQVSSLTRRKKTLESALSVIKDKNQTVATELRNKLTVVATKLQQHEKHKEAASKTATTPKAASAPTFKTPTASSETVAAPVDAASPKVTPVKASPRGTPASAAAPETTEKVATAKVKPVSAATTKVTPPAKPVSKVTPTTSTAKVTSNASTTAVVTTPSPVTAKTLATKVTPAKTTAMKVTPAKTAATKVTPAKSTASKVTPAKTTAIKVTPANTTATKVTPSNTTATKVTPGKPTATKVTPAKTVVAKVTPAKTAMNVTQKKVMPGKTTPGNIAAKRVTGSASQTKPTTPRNTNVVAKTGPKIATKVTPSRFAQKNTVSRFNATNMKPTNMKNLRNGNTMGRVTARSAQFRRNFGGSNRNSFSRANPQQQQGGGLRGYGQRDRASPTPLWNEKPQWRPDSQPPSLTWRSSEPDQFQSTQQRAQPQFGQQQPMQQQQQSFISQQQPQSLFQQNNTRQQQQQPMQQMYQQPGNLQQQQQTQMYQQPQMQQQLYQPQQQQQQQQQQPKYVRPLQQFIQQESSQPYQLAGNNVGRERYEGRDQMSSNWGDMPMNQSPERNFQNTSGGYGDLWSSNDSPQKRPYPSSGSGDFKRQRLSDTTGYAMDRTSGFGAAEQRRSGFTTDQRRSNSRYGSDNNNESAGGFGEQRRGSSAINVLVGLSNVLGSRQPSGPSSGQQGNRGMNYRSTQSSQRKSYGLGGGGWN